MSDVEDSRRLALDVCVAAFKWMLSTNNACSNTISIDIPKLMSWYEENVSLFPKDLCNDDQSMRSFLGYEDFCLDIVSFNGQ